MRHIISVLMENEAGALSRVIDLFSARGYNVDTLSVSPTDDITLSRLTIQTNGDSAIVEQITKQLNKLIEVVKVIDLNNISFVERELMLLKVDAVEKQDMILRLVEIYRAHIVDVSNITYTIELTGSRSKLDSFIKIIGQENIIETVRTGPVGIGRGKNILNV